MRSIMLSVAFLVVILVSGTEGPAMFSQSETKETSKSQTANRKDPIDKALSELSNQVNELKERIGTLETEQREVRARLAQIDQSQGALSTELTEADAELARFDCEPEFDRAHAMALAYGTQGYTLEGAAALTCTQRLAKVTEKAIRSLQHR